MGMLMVRCPKINRHGPVHRIQVILLHPCIFQQHLLSTLPRQA
jgi:hypothetical protein